MAKRYSNQMKKNVEVMAYIHADASGTLRALRFLDGIQIERNSASKFDIWSTASALPEQFFSRNVAHVAAIVGTNSSGKSTSLQDICRILAGERPVATDYSLVMRSQEGVYQLCNHSGLVLFDGQAIPSENAVRNANLKVVFYAGGYDPLGRTKELVPRSTGVEFTDISDQFIYSSDPAHDFDYKLIYLESLIQSRDPSLFLQADGARMRTIRFEASSGYDIDIAARDFFEFALTLTDESHNRAALLEHLNIVSSEETADLFDAIDRKLILQDKGIHFLEEGRAYFELLCTYFGFWPSSAAIFSPLALALAVGRIVELLQADPYDARLAADFQEFHVDFAAMMRTMLGPVFLPSVEELHHAAFEAKMLSDDGLNIGITLTGKLKTTSSVHRVIKLLLQLRSEGVDFSFRFSGISEGQRTLLTFYSRLHMQARRHKHKGNTLLLIDEHEHGLHPEWQRRYLQELINFLGNKQFADERYQIVLSTHSPFLVSDLPATHVNKIGTDIDKTTPTLAANLLELLLSPLFLENTTGEFSRSKITKFLEEIEHADDTESLDAASILLPLLGDDLIRNYCKIRVEEKRRRLAKRRA